MNAVILLGPPGAGKGTVAEVLVDQGCRHVSTGQLLRDEIAKGTPLGIEAGRLIDQGRFVSDETVVGMISDLISESDFDQQYLFDGFPRTLVQAEELRKLLDGVGGRIDHVFLLECPDKVIVERLSGRRTCSKCGSVYHMVYNPPADGDHCDKEGCKLIQRPDDTEETVRKRLSVYMEQTAPLIEFYDAQGLIIRVDATQSIEHVRDAVAEKLG